MLYCFPCKIVFTLIYGGKNIVKINNKKKMLQNWLQFLGKLNYTFNGVLTNVNELHYNLYFN